MKTMSLTAARMKRAGKLTAALGDEQVRLCFCLINAVIPIAKLDQLKYITSNASLYNRIFRINKYP